jgi:VWFA-related protein
MRSRWVYLGIALWTACAGAGFVAAQEPTAQEPTAQQARPDPPQPTAPQPVIAQPDGRGVPYTMSVPVNEVSVMFQASDFHGVPIRDLTLGDLRVQDNGKVQHDVVSFQMYRDLPIRAGFLIDTSKSVLENLRRNQQISSEYVRLFMRRQSSGPSSEDQVGDEAFVMGFDFESKLVQGWTGERDLLTSAIRSVATDHESRVGGTAIFDAVYSACRDEFGGLGDSATGNFILLFSDGLDNASHARIEDDVSMCQQSNTAIFVFSAASKSMFIEGQKTLSDLAADTGGRIFFDQKSENVNDELRSIEANLRNQYRLVYKPAKLKADGSFHRIKLDSPSRGGVITARSGYFAPRSKPMD